MDMLDLHCQVDNYDQPDNCGNEHWRIICPDDDSEWTQGQAATNDQSGKWPTNDDSCPA